MLSVLARQLMFSIALCVVKSRKWQNFSLFWVKMEIVLFQLFIYHFYELSLVKNADKEEKKSWKAHL